MFNLTRVACGMRVPAVASCSPAQTLHQLAAALLCFALCSCRPARCLQELDACRS